MSPLAFVVAAFALSILGGLLGSLLGLGGGIVVVPALTLVLGVDIRLAIAASMVAVIATSSGSAIAYTRDRLSNVRVAMFLEVATVAGGITGALVAGAVAPAALALVFAGVQVGAAVTMVRRRRDAGPAAPSPLAERLRLHSSYPDRVSGTEVAYRVGRPGTGFGIMYVAGITSGMLGVGGGLLKVPALDLAMRLPIKVSTATSNLMMGVTATGAALVYLGRGEVDPAIAAPVALGVLLGANVGARIMPRIDPQVVRYVFVAVLLVSAVQMAVRG